VVIQVNNRDLKLMPGMTANVSVIIVTKNDVLRITNAALRFRFTEKSAAAAAGAGPSEKKGPSVWVLENGKPKRAGISPGISDGTYTEVASGDLKEGQNIIVEALKKGAKPQGPSGPRMF
jgi:HlyD family secretion protein